MWFTHFDEWRWSTLCCFAGLLVVVAGWSRVNFLSFGRGRVACRRRRFRRRRRIRGDARLEAVLRTNGAAISPSQAATKAHPSRPQAPSKPSPCLEVETIVNRLAHQALSPSNMKPNACVFIVSLLEFHNL